MNGVLGRPCLARQDIAIGIRRTQRFGARWLVSHNPDGSAAEPKDLAGYSAEFRIASSAGSLWLSKLAEVETGPNSSGLVSVTIGESDTSAPEWATRSLGKWSLVMTGPSGDVTVLAAGVARIIQEGTA